MSIPSWNNFYKYDLGVQLPDGVRPSLKAISGAIVAKNGRTVWAGINSAWMVEQYLKSLNVPLRRVTPPKWGIPLAEVPPMPEMRETVPGFQERFPHYLLPWQREGVVRFGHRPSVQLFWSPGAGKSLGAIVWALLAPGLIVFITKSAARQTIAADVRRFTHITPLVLDGQRIDAIPEETRMVITGWDTLVHQLPILLAARPVTVVMDEIHRAKQFKRRIAVPRMDERGNAILNEKGEQAFDFKERTNVAMAAEKLSRACQRRLGATGTPIKDRIRDIWGQMDLIEPGEWGGFYDFAKRYASAGEGVYGGIVTTGRASEPYIQELYQRLSLSVLSVPYHVTHKALPPKRRQVTYLSPEDLLDETTEARTMVESAAKSKSLHGMAHARLAAAAARKRSAMAEMVVDSIGSNTKVLVMTGLREESQKLHAAISKKLPDVTSWFANGEHSIKVRDTIREEYMAHPGPCILVGTTDSWGESVNLHDSDILFVGMLPYTPGQVEQLEGRVSRQGQKRPCLIHYVVAESTYDEHVAQLLLDKLPAVEKVAGAGGLSGFGESLSGLTAASAAEIEATLLSKLLSSTAEIDEDSR